MRGTPDEKAPPALFYYVVVPFFIAACSFVVLIFTAVHLGYSIHDQPIVAQNAPVARPTYDVAVTVQAIVCLVEFVIMCACVVFGTVFWRRRRRRRGQTGGEQ